MPRRTTLSRALIALLSVLALTMATQTVTQTASAAPPAPPFSVRPGTTQLEVLSADGLVGDQLELVHAGAVVKTGTVDSHSSPMTPENR